MEIEPNAGMKQKGEVMALMDGLCRGFTSSKYSYRRAPEYLKAFAESIESCSMGDTSLSITLNPGLFTKHYELVKDIFPSTAWRLRNRTRRNCYVRSGEFKLELLGHDCCFGGTIYKGDTLVSVTFGRPDATYESWAFGTGIVPERLPLTASIKDRVAYDLTPKPLPPATSTDSGKQFMELVRADNGGILDKASAAVELNGIKERLTGRYAVSELHALKERIFSR